MSYQLEDIIRDHFLDDIEMFLDIAEGFIDEYPCLLEGIDKAIEESAPKKITLSVHKLRGAVSSFRVKKINSLMSFLEESSHLGADLAFLRKYSELKVNIDSLIEKIRSMTSKKSA